MKPVDTPMLSYFGEPSIGAWKSDIYNAFAFHDKYAIRLDIEKVDKTDGITWDEIQNIKGFRKQPSNSLHHRKHTLHIK